MENFGNLRYISKHFLTEKLQNKTKSVFSFFDLFQQGTGSFFAGFFTTSPFHSQDKTKDVISIMNRLESKTSCASELGKIIV